MRHTVIITFEKGVAEDHCYEAWSLLADYLTEKGVFEQLEDILPKMSRVWTEIVTTPEGKKCVGFMTLSQVWDVSNFHCEDERARARLIQRAATVIEESQGRRSVALVYVNPEAEKDWKPFLAQIGAQRANRWLVPTSPEFEKGGENDAHQRVHESVQSKEQR